MRWIIGSQSTPIRIDGDMHQTITTGIGHLHKAEPVQSVRQADPVYPVYLCEPLVVLFLSSIYAKHLETTIPNWVADAARTSRGPSSLGLILKEALLVVLT